MVSSSLGLMVFCWLSGSHGLLAASHGLMVSWSSGGSHGLMVFSLPLMVYVSPFPLGFSRSHPLAVSWSSGCSHGLLIASHGLGIAPSPWDSHCLIVLASHRPLVSLLVSYSPIPLWLPWSHGLLLSWSSGGS